MQDFRMETFLTVCETMNFTKAASKLNMTQPAVSQHIHFLEEAYEIKLFYSQGKRIFLTEAGEILRNFALTLKHDEIHLKNKLISTLIPKKEFIFGATLTIAEFILPQKIKSFLSRSGGSQIQMRVRNTHELLRELDAGEIDFAIIEGYFPKEEYDYITYSVEPYIAICSPGDYNRLQNASLEDLLNETLILREDGSGTREILQVFLTSKNLSFSDFKNRMVIENIGAIKKLTADGCGISFLYQKAVEEELKSGVLKKLDLQEFSLSHELMFIFRKNSLFKTDYEKFYKYFS